MDVMHGVEIPRVTLDEVRRYAKAKARGTGLSRVIVCNTRGDFYMHETPEDWEASKGRRPNCVLVERVDP